ncbi:MAG TPA: GNAT family N-acetyltransferase [Burkholderiales bacterium]|nr:GNAT family N-acetyltransferase [Burkholderiales bacterium]
MGNNPRVLPEVTCRDAERRDAKAIAALYAYYVETSSATFEETPPGRAEIAKRIKAVQDAGLPWIVATDAHGALLGYAYASPYRTRSAYRYTIENSVYVAPGTIGSGIGSTIMREVIDRCTRAGYRQMLAVIGGSGNIASIALHERLGFRMVGTHRAIGYKQDRWIDVIHMQLALGESSNTAP